MTSLEFKIFVAAAKQIGAPYVWCGKGERLWSPSGPLSSSFKFKVFDCSGLVTFAFRQAGLKDATMIHNAKSLYRKLKPLRGGSSVFLEAHPALAFYGKDEDSIDHVAIIFSLYGTMMLLEAGGGGRTTLSPTPGAAVRMAVPKRTDLIGLRMFPESDTDL